MFESSDEDDQRGAESSSRMWAEPEPEPGPSTCEPSRQGYCSYCRVLYRDLDQHLSSLQHLDSVHTSSRSSGSSVSISRSKHTLLERFLHDVLQHHPHRYNDPRPSHSDLPPVSAPVAPNREVSEGGGGGGRTQAASEVTRQSANQERDDAHSCGRSKERLREGAGRVGQQEEGNTQAPPPLHRKAHRKTDRRKSSVSSSELTRRGPPHPAPDTGFDADSGPGPGSARQPLEPRPSVSWQKQRQGTLKEQGDSVDQTIEQVIRTYCSGGGWTPFQKETTSLDLGAPVSLGTPSEDWDVVVQVQQAGGAQDLSQLMEARVDLQDQVYPVQLDLALRREDPRDPASPTPLPQEEEEVLPVSEDVPKSFRGKTWTQIRVEDEERVEKLVQQFREGKFVCYFDSESLARFGRRSRSRKGQGHLQAQQDSDPDPDPDPLPLLDHDGDSGSARRARRRRSFRLASRCQVVKVSQATQTFHLVAPVVHQLLSDPPQTTTPPPTQAAAAVERTPDMLRWRRLPSSYSTVITPLQPRTSLVYLLCSPPGPALHAAAAAASPAGSVPKRCRKKRRPLDAQGLLKVKYKRFPVRLYDLSSNQILRNAPKGFVWYQGSAPSSPAPPCVRQLFRSLSTDLNTEGGQRSADATPPFGSRCPLSALSKGAALSDKRSVLRRRGQASEAPPPPPPSEPQAPRAPKRRARTEAKPPALRRGTLRQSGAEPAPHQNVRGRTRRGRSCEKSQR